jgi:hypothetical protein
MLSKLEVLDEATSMLRTFVQMVAEMDNAAQPDDPDAFVCAICAFNGDTEQHYDGCLIPLAVALLRKVDQNLAELP